MTQTAVLPRVHDHAEHAMLLSRMNPNVAGWRGCAGVALVFYGDTVNPRGEGDSTQTFLPTDKLAWVTGVDVPVPWISGLGRPAHLMQVRHAALRYGAPVLDQATVAREFDYWDGPTPDLPAELVRAADGLNDAMTSTAFAYRSVWAPYASLFADYAGLAGVPRGEPPVLLGSRMYGATVVKDFGWVPRPWVEVDPKRAGTAFRRLKELGYTPTFRAVAADLFAAGMPVTAPVEGFFTGTSPLVVNGVQYTQFNFREKNGAKHAVVATAGATPTSVKGLPVFRGTQVGTDAPPVPPGYYGWSRDRQWGELTRAYAPAALDLVLGSAFSAMFRQCGSAWLLPYEVIGADVSYAFGEGGLWWDVSTVLTDEYDGSVPSPNDHLVHIMPTVRMRQWDDFRGHLGATAVNLTPVRPDFAAHALGRQTRKFPVTADGHSGDAQGEVVPVAVVPGQPAGRLPELNEEEQAMIRASAANRRQWAARRARANGDPIEVYLGAPR